MKARKYFTHVFKNTTYSANEFYWLANNISIVLQTDPLQSTSDIPELQAVSKNASGTWSCNRTGL